MATNVKTPPVRSNWTVENLHQRVSLALLLVRIGVFIMMIVWAIDKFVRPQHSTAVFEIFYGVGGVGVAIAYLIGAVQLAIFVAFLLGFRKRLTYGLVLIIHAASTLVAFPLYLQPYDPDPNSANILFYAAWPVLAACFALYSLRDLDTRFTID